MSVITASVINNWYTNLNNIRSKHGYTAVAIPTIVTSSPLLSSHYNDFGAQVISTKGLDSYLNTGVISFVNVQSQTIVRTTSKTTMDDTLVSLSKTCQNTSNSRETVNLTVYSVEGYSSNGTCSGYHDGTKDSTTYNSTCNPYRSAYSGDHQGGNGKTTNVHDANYSQEGSNCLNTSETVQSTNRSNDGYNAVTNRSVYNVLI